MMLCYSGGIGNVYLCYKPYAVLFSLFVLLGYHRIYYRYRAITVFLRPAHSIFKLAYQFLSLFYMSAMHHTFYARKLIVYIVTYLRHLVTLFLYLLKVLFFKLTGIFQRVYLTLKHSLFLNIGYKIHIDNIRNDKRYERNRQNNIGLLRRSLIITVRLIEMIGYNSYYRKHLGKRKKYKAQI